MGSPFLLINKQTNNQSTMIFSLVSLLTISLGLVSARFAITPDMDAHDGKDFCKENGGRIAKVSKSDLEAVKYILQSAGVGAVRIDKKSDISKAKKKHDAAVLYFDAEKGKWATIGDKGEQEIATLCREKESSKHAKKRHAKRAKQEKKDEKKDKKDKIKAKRVLKKTSKEEEYAAYKAILEQLRSARKI